MKKVIGIDGKTEYVPDQQGETEDQSRVNQETQKLPEVGIAPRKIENPAAQEVFRADKKSILQLEADAKASGKLIEMPTGEKRAKILSRFLNREVSLDDLNLTEANAAESVNEILEIGEKDKAA